MFARASDDEWKIFNGRFLLDLIGSGKQIFVNGVGDIFDTANPVGKAIFVYRHPL